MKLFVMVDNDIRQATIREIFAFHLNQIIINCCEKSTTYLCKVCISQWLRGDDGNLLTSCLLPPSIQCRVQQELKDKTFVMETNGLYVIC